MEEIIAKQYLCFPALLEMLICETSGISMSQTDIAEWFGVTVPLNYTGKLRNIRKSDDCLDYGIHVSQEDINSFFVENNLPLKLKYIDIKYINELFFYDRMKHYLKTTEMIVCSYSYGCLYGINTALRLGHVSAILAVNEHGIDIYDPGPDRSGVKSVNELLLYDSIRYRGGGIYLFSKI